MLTTAYKSKGEALVALYNALNETYVHQDQDSLHMAELSFEERDKTTTWVGWDIEGRDPVALLGLILETPAGLFLPLMHAGEVQATEPLEHTRV